MSHLLYAVMIAAIASYGAPPQEIRVFLRHVSGKEIEGGLLSDSDPNKPYRGRLEIRKDGNEQLALVHALPLEEYLYGVLPAEMDTKIWPLEALKAQAVVSRTYALLIKERHNERVYHLSGNSDYQMYDGANLEDGRAHEAVDATQGEILIDREGQVIEAYFHSCCGGHTAYRTEAWFNNAPGGLAGVTDFGYCKLSPHYAWVTSLPRAELEQALIQLGSPLTSPVRALHIGRLGPSGRVLSLKVTGKDSRFEIPTASLRRVLGPNWIRSTKILHIEFKKDRFLLYGRGWGHGVGLCQWGAKGMAEKGYSYKQILRHYFPESGIGKKGV